MLTPLYSSSFSRDHSIVLSDSDSGGDVEAGSVDANLFVPNMWEITQGLKIECESSQRETGSHWQGKGTLSFLNFTRADNM